MIVYIQIYVEKLSIRCIMAYKIMLANEVSSTRRNNDIPLAEGQFLVAWSFQCGAFHCRQHLIPVNNVGFSKKHSKQNTTSEYSFGCEEEEYCHLGWIERQGRQAWLKDTKHIEIFFLHHRSSHSYPDSAEKLPFYIQKKSPSNIPLQLFMFSVSSDFFKMVKTPKGSCRVSCPSVVSEDENKNFPRKEKGLQTFIV